MRASPSDYIPQFSSDRRPLLDVVIDGRFCLLIMGMIIGAPLALAGGHSSWAVVCLRRIQSSVPSNPDRSFFIAGHQFAVCSRCTGLYGGFRGRHVCYPLCRARYDARTLRRRKWLFLAAAPVAIDFSLGFFGIWENTHFSRFADRSAAGIGIGVLRHAGID